MSTLGEADLKALAAFADFLWDPTSRCIICLTDEPEVKFWRNHRRLGRVFICGSCHKARYE